MFVSVDHRETGKHPCEMKMRAFFDHDDLVTGWHRVSQQFSGVVSREGSSDDHNVFRGIHRLVTVTMDRGGDFLVDGIAKSSEGHSHELEYEDRSIKHFFRYNFMLKDAQFHETHLTMLLCDHSYHVDVRRLRPSHVGYLRRNKENRVSET